MKQTLHFFESLWKHRTQVRPSFCNLMIATTFRGRQIGKTICQNPPSRWRRPETKRCNTASPTCKSSTTTKQIRLCIILLQSVVCYTYPKVQTVLNCNCSCNLWVGRTFFCSMFDNQSSGLLVLRQDLSLLDSSIIEFFSSWDPSSSPSLMKKWLMWACYATNISPPELMMTVCCLLCCYYYIIFFNSLLRSFYLSSSSLFFIFQLILFT